ncbi:MAG TPA: hypothetical protein ENI06_09535 [Spirochaetales bacterium]|nr:hypothetical protein [Spirochaetales bacterium]
MAILSTGLVISKDLLSKLENLESESERIYLNLGQRLSDLFKELERGFAESSQLISYFAAGQSGAEKLEEHSLVEEIITEAREVIEEAAVFFNEMQERDNVLFSSINEGIDHLSSLDGRIENIRDDSIEMELISLNAMTVALKAGLGGRAFSYITEELKKLSSRTIIYTEELTRSGASILKDFLEFRKLVGEIQAFQQRFFGDFQEKLNKCFDRYNMGVKQLAEMLFGVIEEAKAVKKPLYRIMEEVQLQDIIKQSLEHVLLSLKEFDLDPEAEYNDHLLDELSFVEKLPRLCQDLLDDISLKIRQSRDLFSTNLTDIRSTLRDVEEQRGAFLEYFTDRGENELEGGALEQMFAESVGVLKELLSGIDRSMTGKKAIGRDGNRIIENITVLKTGFENFFEIIDRFYAIEVASRIQVAKQEVLRDRTETVNEMTRLTSRIDDDVKEALRILKDALTKIYRIINRYSDKVEMEMSVVQETADCIKSSYDRLMFSKTTLADTLKNFSVYSERFLSLLDASEGDILHLGMLVKVISEVKDELADVQARAETLKREVLQDMGLQEWQIKDDKLQTMIERFTIFTHKKVAGELGGFEVEEGSLEGELTLF